MTSISGKAIFFGVLLAIGHVPGPSTVYRRPTTLEWPCWQTVEWPEASRYPWSWQPESPQGRYSMDGRVPPHVITSSSRSPSSPTGRRFKAEGSMWLIDHGRAIFVSEDGGQVPFVRYRTTWSKQGCPIPA